MLFVSRVLLQHSERLGPRQTMRQIISPEFTIMMISRHMQQRTSSPSGSVLKLQTICLNFTATGETTTDSLSEMASFNPYMFVQESWNSYTDRTFGPNLTDLPSQPGKGCCQESELGYSSASILTSQSTQHKSSI